jgi:hypothetical protein
LTIASKNERDGRTQAHTGQHEAAALVKVFKSAPILGVERTSSTQTPNGEQPRFKATLEVTAKLPRYAAAIAKVLAFVKAVIAGASTSAFVATATTSDIGIAIAGSASMLVVAAPSL